jgi:hypothetical protein
MTRAVAAEPSDLILSSVTETQEQLDHAVSENWKAPFVPKVEQEAEAKKKEIEEEVKAKLAEKEDADDKNKHISDDTEQSSKEDGEESLEERAQRLADEEEPVKGKWSKRVNKLTARNVRLAEEARAANERALSLEARLAALERGEKPAAGTRTEDAPNVADLPNKPKRAEFKDDETYLDKMIQWTKANEEYREGAAAEQSRLQENFANHRERLAQAREEHEDWDAVAKSAESMTIPPAVEMAIMEMENSAEVLYYLASHPEAYEKMSELTPFRQIGEATRISDKLAAKIAPAKRARSAPPEPISPGGKRPTKSSVKLDDMSTDDYLAARRQMRAQRRAN